MPCFEPVLTIAAAVPCLIMSGANTCTPLITPQRLTSMIRRQSAGSPNKSLPRRSRRCSSAGRPRRTRRRPRSSGADIVEAADVDSEGSHGVRLRRGGADLRGAGLERLAAQVRHAHFHAERGEFR